MTYRERRQAGFDRVSHEMATLNPPDKTQDVPQSRILRFKVDGVQIKLPYFRAKDGEMFFDAIAINDMFQGCPCYTCGRVPEGRRLRCSICRKAYYCSTECQRIDWSVHKGECTAKL